MIAKRTLISSAIACWLAGGSAASAEPGLVLVHGGATEPERGVVATAIEAAVQTAGWTLPATPPAAKDADALLTCSDTKQAWSCIPASLQAVRRMLIVGVERRSSDGTPMVVLTGKALVPSEQVVVVGERYCERCAGDQLRAAAVELAARILRELAVRSGRTTLVVTSRPTGAQISLDGDFVGVTDTSVSTYPGSHKVVLEKAGFLSVKREILVEEGQTVTLSEELRPAGLGERPKPPPRRPSRLLPGLVIGTGASLLVMGGLLIYLDEDMTLTGQQYPTYFDSARYGVGYAIAGALVGAGGLYWWHRRTKARTTPTMSVTSHGGTVGWSGSF
jgi:hypothetical protein